MLRCALITSVVLFANVARSQAESPLKPGDMVILECLGDNAEKDGKRYLNGQTKEGVVGLAAETGRRFSGTKWKVVKLDKGGFGFECQGNLNGDRWLDGRTGVGTVGLAPKTGGRFTGTNWKVHDRGDGTIQLECLGEMEGPRWLNGLTADAAAQLTDDHKLSGTFWKVRKAE